MVCLDTTFIADIERKDSKAIQKLKELLSDGGSMTTTIINIAELYKGAYLHPRRAEKLKTVDKYTQVLIILGLTIEATKQYGYHYTELRNKGLILSDKEIDRDLLIASICLTFNEDQIITRNVRHFERIPGLNVISY